MLTRLLTAAVLFIFYFIVRCVRRFLPLNRQYDRQLNFSWEDKVMQKLQGIKLSLSRIRFRWLLLLGAIVLSLGACHWHHDNASAHHGKMLEKGTSLIAYKLDFDSEQKKILQAMTSEIVSIREQKKSEHAVREAKITALLRADELDMQVLEQMISTHRQQFDEFIPQLLPHIQQLHSTLSEDQKDKIEHHMKKRFRRHYSS